MIQPVELKSIKPEELPCGYTSTTAEGWQMLSACRAGDLGAVRSLVERCHGLIRYEYNYTPPIHFAVREGHAPLVRYLLDCGADPTYRTYRFNDSLLQMARASNETGDTALHLACAGGQSGVAELLLDRGADPEAVRSDGFKPIHSALFWNRQGYLRQHKPPVDTLRAGRLAGLLLERGAAYNIFLAAVFGDLPAVKKWLAEDSALANFEDTHHRRPISAAAWREDIDMVRLLLEHGADPSLPESESPRGHALWIAAFRKNVEMARLLLEHGADPESNAESGGRALQHARANPELYQLLIDHGSEPRESPSDRLHDAIHDDDLEAAEAILKENPDLAPDPAMFWGEGILALPAREIQWGMMDLLFRYGAKVPDVTKWGISYYFRHLDVAKYMMEKGMHPNHMNWHHTTLLHDAAHGGSSSVEKAQLLLEYGADIDAIDEEYLSTPLGLAARVGRLELVKLLLERGANPTAAGAPWATPLAWAKKRGHQEIVALLERRVGGS